MKLYDRIFITGCDHNTEWMLEWFLENFRKHNPWNNAMILVCDFGMTEVGENNAILADGIINMTSNTQKGWFKKPAAMIEASKIANYVCWLDTDCEIKGSLQTIFEYIEPNKLLMAEDKPWSTRRAEKWHNSGVVAFKGCPAILTEWEKAVKANPFVGDQEVLHQIVSKDMKRLINITDLPRKFNTLRLDLDDNSAPDDIKIMHWTGHKGKEYIRGLINE